VKHPRDLDLKKGKHQMTETIKGKQTKLKPLSLSVMEMEKLYGGLPIGKKNAITRVQLSNLWDLSDRQARLIIAELRAWDNGDDYVIVSYSNGKGYFRTNDPEEIQGFASEMRARALNVFAPLRKARRILDKPQSGLLFDGEIA
jgi:hypothetical protein